MSASPSASAATGPRVQIESGAATALLFGCAEGIELQAVRHAIEVARVRMNPDDEARLASLIDDSGRVKCDDGTIIARSVPPVNDEPTRVEAMALDRPDPGARQIDYRAAARLPLFSKGQPVARIRPHTPGRDGVNVLGAPITRRTCRAESVKLKKNVAFGSDPNVIVATVDGLLRLDKLTIWVDPLLEIKRDVDFSTGHIEFGGDISIGGSVLDLFHVRASGTITIGQSINASEVHAEHDIQVHGGIIGRQKGVCTAGGNVQARFIHGATITARGQVVAQTEITQAHITADAVIVENGSIHASAIYAREVRCKDLGSPSAVTTLVHAGKDEGLEHFARDTMPALREEFARLQTMHDQVSALLKNQRAISAAQKERATEMLFEISEKRNAVAGQVREWRQRLLDTQTCVNAVVKVQHTIYPGVRLHIGDLEADIETAMSGPLSIQVRPVRGVRKMICIGPGGSLVLLPCHTASSPAVETARKFLDEHGGPVTAAAA
jgi:uncharacterized protein (DUF342 family)